MSKRVLVIGSCNIDFIMQVDHLPAPGETVTEGKFTQTFGGKGANQAVAAARAGVTTAFITGIGDDPFGPKVRENLIAEGIDIGNAVTATDTPCGCALITIDKTAENCIAVAPGANDAVTSAHIDGCEQAIADAALVLLQMEIPPATNARVLEIAGRHRTPVLLNYAPTRGVPLALSDAIAGLIVNETEAAALLGDVSVAAEDAVKRLADRGPGFVILTLGEAGAIVYVDGKATTVSAFKVEPVDTTAAGDTFCGALAAAIVEGKSLTDAARFASAAAALACSQLGAQPSVPHRDAIDALMANG